MSLVALTGDCTTTTAVALAAAWPNRDEVVVTELDPSGGSLAAWFDTAATPSLSTFVATRPATGVGFDRSSADASDPADAADAAVRWRDVEAIVHQSSPGVRFIACPFRAREATRSIGEAAASLLPALESAPVTALADTGQSRPGDPFPAALRLARAIVVTHRQEPASAGAASVRLERLVEALEQLSTLESRMHLAVIGNEPFDVDEVAGYVAAQTSVVFGSVTAVAVDALSAMTFAGRAGVSAKRLARLPLLRSIAPLADRLAEPAARIATGGPRTSFETVDIA